MSTAKPHKSPNASTDVATDPVARLMRPPYVWTVLLLFIGVCFLLLLNGQVFTNALVFLGFAAVSAILWVPLIVRSKQNDHQRLAFYVVLGHLVFIIAFATGLPEKYRWQQKFNNFGKELQQRTRKTVDQ